MGRKLFILYLLAYVVFFWGGGVDIPTQFIDCSSFFFSISIIVFSLLHLGRQNPICSQSGYGGHWGFYN